MEKEEEEVTTVCSKGGGCVGSRDYADKEVKLVDSGIMYKKLYASDVSEQEKTPRRAGSWSSTRAAASNSTKSSNPRHIYRRRRKVTWSESTPHIEDEVTDIETLPSFIVEDALERRLYNDGSWAIVTGKLTSPRDSEYRLSHRTRSFDRSRLKNFKLNRSFDHLYGFPTALGDDTSDISTPIVQHEVYDEPPDQPEENSLSETTLKNRIAVDTSSSAPYIIPLSSVCDACEYCEDTCDLEDCRDCLIKQEKSKCSQYFDPALREFTTCQVRRHNITGSCWLVCDNRIYDSTIFLEDHPGGKVCILKSAGGVKNCTADYNFHSKKAQKLWCTFFIGKMVQCPGHHRQTEHCSNNYPVQLAKKGKDCKNGDPWCLIS